MTSRVAKRYRILTSFGNYTKGQIVELSGGVASVWAQRRMIEPYEGDPPAVAETASLEPDVERAVQPSPEKRRPGRPRKVRPDELGDSD